MEYMQSVSLPSLSFHQSFICNYYFVIILVFSHTLFVLFLKLYVIMVVRKRRYIDLPNADSGVRINFDIVNLYNLCQSAILFVARFYNLFFSPFFHNCILQPLFFPTSFSQNGVIRIKSCCSPFYDSFKLCYIHQMLYPLK